jgi:hypothetical protein
MPLLQPPSRPAKVLLTTDFPNERTAWSKARLDVCEILEHDGYEALYFPELKSPMRMAAFFSALKKKMRGGGHLLIEYPFDQRKRAYLLSAFKRLTGVKIYAIIHDINSLRFNSCKKSELTILKLFDGIVSHNPSMTRWLTDNDIVSKVVDLNVFDYCSGSTHAYHEKNLSYPLKLLYAGNLSPAKATYIYDDELASVGDIQIAAYGPNYEADRMSHRMISHKGAFDPSSPELKGLHHFGLVWEGNSLESCEGEYGNYLRFNNPHKLSLYISLGLPVVIWEKAAMAQFVLAHNIGVTVGRLKDLEHVLKTVSNERYKTMLRNLSHLTPKVKNGHFMRTAVQSVTQ